VVDWGGGHRNGHRGLLGRGWDAGYHITSASRAQSGGRFGHGDIFLHEIPILAHTHTVPGSFQGFAQIGRCRGIMQHNGNRYPFGFETAALPNFGRVEHWQRSAVQPGSPIVRGSASPVGLGWTRETGLSGKGNFGRVWIRDVVRVPYRWVICTGHGDSWESMEVREGWKNTLAFRTTGM